MPLRPLALNDILTGAVSQAQRNPAATYGLVAIVISVSSVVAALAVRFYISRFVSVQPGQPAQQQFQDFVSSSVGTVLPVVLGLGVLVFLVYAVLTGLLSVVIGRGILGHKISLLEAVRTGRVAAVIATSVLLILVFDVAVPAPVVALVVVLAKLHQPLAAGLLGVIGGIGTEVFEFFLVVRLSVTLPTVVLERVSPITAIRRSFQLSRGNFWRLFGFQALAGIVTYIVFYAMTLPWLIVILLLVAGGPLRGSSGITIAWLLVAAVWFISIMTIVIPFVVGVDVLQYVDLRMRREGLDLTLRDAAQNRALTGDEFANRWQSTEHQPTPSATW